MAVKGKIRIRLKGYDHSLVDKASEKIVETAKRTGKPVGVGGDIQKIHIFGEIRHDHRGSFGGSRGFGRKIRLGFRGGFCG